MEKRSKCYSKIDELSDEILITIIGKLDSVKKSAKTSLVCRRWRNLWALIPNLNFGEDDARDNQALVNRVLDAYKGSNVESLRIVMPFYVVGDCLSHINKWVKFANDKRVQTLELNFFNYTMNEFLQFPILPVFDRLKSMSLSSISLAEDDFGHLLSVNLETLSLTKIGGLERFQITAPRLKQLMIVDCHTIKTIDLNSAPNLQYFKHYDSDSEFPIQNLSFKNVSKLSSLCLCGPLRIHKALIKLKGIGVKKLVMDTILLCMLKQLELRFVAGHSTYCMHNLISTIISACPCLEKMTLNYKMLKGHNHDVVEVKNTFKHPCLQVVEFIGWCGLEPELVLANYLIGTCTNLRKIVFDSNPPQDLQWRHWYSTDDIEQPDGKAARLSAKQQLMIRKSGLHMLLYDRWIISL